MSEIAILRQLANHIWALHCCMRGRNYAAEARTRLEQYYDNLKRSRKTALLVAVIKRFAEIDGFTLSRLVSIQLFTSVIPRIIIGFAYFSRFEVMPA